MKIIQVSKDDDLADVRQLFREYCQWLAEVHGVIIDTDTVEKELRSLPGEYAPPKGRLIIAYQDDKPVGCGALKPLDEQVCVINRNYIKSAFRGKGYGKILVRRLIEDAKIIGYQRVRLETYSFMYAAQALYCSLGFRIIPNAQNTPHDKQKSTIIMEVVL